MSSPPNFYPATASGWLHSGMPGAFHNNVVGGCPPIAPAFAYPPAFPYVPHHWDPSLAVIQGFGDAPNSGATTSGAPIGRLRYLGGSGSGMTHVGGLPICIAASMSADTPSGAGGVGVPRSICVCSSRKGSQCKPPGAVVAAGRSWGSKESLRCFCGGASCKRWMCHVCLKDEKGGNGASTFVCCSCLRVVGACWCHRCAPRLSGFASRFEFVFATATPHLYSNVF